MLALALLAGCSRQGNIEEGGIYTIRSACPQVAIPAGTGDMTVFDPAGATEASAIDIEAAITNVRTSCQESGDQIISTANFEVVATRRDPTQARQVVLPFFDAAVQAGEKVVAKRVSAVSLNFAPGSLRASTSAQATVRISRAVATLPEDVRKTLTRRRKVGDVDAAIDPLSDPTIRAAVARASFAHLVGFQLTDDQLRYNVTR
ncbi:hypothetical protein H8M03_01220 [Sphingomonas sabuli]|uniref:Uncharacterized protein n=1 Tax=Sphingomonas sabuli TaxID=2764186 RepID=A0A7G9L5N9_9SPHN|nr:hypothetical protein H8M03_01220 [Sphingomonas sabuli]